MFFHMLHGGFPAVFPAIPPFIITTRTTEFFFGVVLAVVIAVVLAAFVFVLAVVAFAVVAFAVVAFAIAAFVSVVIIAYREIKFIHNTSRTHRPI